MSQVPYSPQPSTVTFRRYFDTVPDDNTRRHQEIRQVLKANARGGKTWSGHKRGKKWVETKQAECAILGHKFGRRDECFYCGVKQV